MDATQQPHSLSLVKRIFIRSFAWGTGCGLVLAAGTVILLFYEQSPKLWNTNALRVKRVEAEGISRVNKKFEELGSGIAFSVDVENATAADLTLARTLTTMGQTRGSHSLHGSFLKLDADYFLPARHVTTIYLEFDDKCAANYPPQECFDSFFKNDEDVVIFDDLHKYEILISVPKLTLSREHTMRMAP